MNFIENTIQYIEFSVPLQHELKCIVMNLRVKEICRIKGVTMEKIAADLGITPNTLTRNINGNPTIETLERIATALNVPVSELFDQPATDIINCPYCGGKIKVSKE